MDLIKNEIKYPGCILNDPEIGNIFLINDDKESLKSVGVYDGEDIVDLKGKLLCQYPSGFCLLSVKIKYQKMNNTIIDTTVLLPKKMLKILKE
jgi:hypothetical protein